MRKPQNKMNPRIKSQITKIFYQLIADLRTPQEPKSFCQDFLTEGEQMMLAKRLATVLYLDKKRSYSNIKKTLKVSSATIAEMYKKMQNQGIQLALQKIKTDEWAEEWAFKISSFLSKFIK
jgi:uncharacterized protein YerC